MTSIRPTSIFIIALALATGCGSEAASNGGAGSTGEDDHDDHDHDDHDHDHDDDHDHDHDDDDGEGGSGGDDGSEGAAASARVLVADAESARVDVVSLADGSVVESFEVGSVARVVATEAGRVAAVIQPEANRVDFIDSGLKLEAHGDHAHQEADPPEMLTSSVLGDDFDAVNPVHFVSHHGFITIHFDGEWNDEEPEQSLDSKNLVFDEDALWSGDAKPLLALATGPQHGVSVVVDGRYVVITEPSLDRERSALPSGVSVRSLDDGSVLQMFNDGDAFTASCWGLHGEASLGDDILFGCHEVDDGGIWVVSRGGDTFSTRKIEYPGYPEATERTSVMKAHEASGWIVGQWGYYAHPDSFYDGLVRIDPSAERIEAEDTLELGSVYCSFDFERTQGEQLVALTRDGKLHLVDVADWNVAASIEVLPDLTEDAACAGQLALGDSAAVLTDTMSGALVVVDLESFEVDQVFEIGGSPASLAYLTYAE